MRTAVLRNTTQAPRHGNAQTTRRHTGRDRCINATQHARTPQINARASSTRTQCDGWSKDEPSISDCSISTPIKNNPYREKGEKGQANPASNTTIPEGKNPIQKTDSGREKTTMAPWGGTGTNQKNTRHRTAPSTIHRLAMWRRGPQQEK